MELLNLRNIEQFLDYLIDQLIRGRDKSKDLNTNTFLRGIHEDVVNIAKIVDAYCQGR